MSEPEYRHLKTSTEQGVVVLTVTEKELRDEEVCRALREELIDVVDKSQAKKVVVDLGLVEFVASVGFRPLLGLSRKLYDVGGRMVLCNLSKIVADVFYTTRLLISSRPTEAPFQEEPDLAAAIANLNGTA